MGKDGNLKGGRGPGRRWVKGQSGNPAGMRPKSKVRRPKPGSRTADGKFLPGSVQNPKGRAAKVRIFSNLAVEARKFAPLALDVLVDLMKSDPSGSVRLSAALAVLDRGFGKPAQSIDLKTDGPLTQTINLFEGVDPADQRLAAETLAAINANPAALSLALDVMADPQAMTGTIPDDVIIDLEADDVIELEAERVE
jgi:hypothetical protein